MQLRRNHSHSLHESQATNLHRNPHELKDYHDYDEEEELYMSEQSEEGTAVDCESKLDANELPFNRGASSGV